MVTTRRRVKAKESEDALTSPAGKAPSAKASKKSTPAKKRGPGTSSKRSTPAKKKKTPGGGSSISSDDLELDDTSFGGVSVGSAKSTRSTLEIRIEKQLLKDLESLGRKDFGAGRTQARRNLFDCREDTYGKLGEPIRDKLRKRIDYLQSLSDDKWKAILLRRKIKPTQRDRTEIQELYSKSQGKAGKARKAGTASKDSSSEEASEPSELTPVPEEEDRKPEPVPSAVPSSVIVKKQNPRKPKTAHSDTVGKKKPTSRNDNQRDSQAVAPVPSEIPSSVSITTKASNRMERDDKNRRKCPLTLFPHFISPF